MLKWNQRTKWTKFIECFLQTKKKKKKPVIFTRFCNQNDFYCHRCCDHWRSLKKLLLSIITVKRNAIKRNWCWCNDRTVKKNNRKIDSKNDNNFLNLFIQKEVKTTQQAHSMCSNVCSFISLKFLAFSFQFTLNYSYDYFRFNSLHISNVNVNVIKPKTFKEMNV